jgi:hypothetical protein
MSVAAALFCVYEESRQSLTLISVERMQLSAASTENLNRLILLQDLAQLTSGQHVSHCFA